MSKHMLKGGYELILDDDDDWLADTFSLNPIVRRGRVTQVAITTSIHRLVLNAKPGSTVDHINNNALDNRKVNLRFVSLVQNEWNKQNKGYYYRQDRDKWKATASVGTKPNRRYIQLGYFETEIEAAFAVWEWRKKHRGEFAVMPPILATAVRDEDGLIV